MNYARSVCIGKFIPPHRGHEYLIRTALAQSGEVHVIVCSRPTDAIPAELRAAWLRELCPPAQVMVIDDRYDDDDSALWARLTIGWLGFRPDAVFTSEDYGPRYAAELGCAHVCVDRARLAVPCSGTAVRSDPFLHWDFISPPVREWFALRICLLGAESTGTTTLTAALAEDFQTTWVAEYGRQYSAEKQQRGDDAWRSEEFVAIAQEQNRREDLAARAANRVVFCDTNSFATTLWHRRYLGHEHAPIAEVAATHAPDLYLLTGDEIPFVQDGLRDGEHLRHEMHGWFEAALRDQPVPWQLVTGPLAERRRAAREAIRPLLAGSAWIQPA